jgi:hypothetical protein
MLDDVKVFKLFVLLISVVNLPFSKSTNFLSSHISVEHEIGLIYFLFFINFLSTLYIDKNFTFGCEYDVIGLNDSLDLHV